MNRLADVHKFFALAALLIILLLFAVLQTVLAAEQLTLDQAIDIAVRNNPGLQAAKAQVEAAEAGVLKSSSGFLPKAALSETWSRSDNPLMVLGTKLNREIISPVDFNPQTMNNPDPMSNYNTRLAVVQPVWNGGKEYLGVKQAKLARDAAVQDQNRVREETIFNVVKAYYGVLLAREQYRVALQSLETSEANVKLAEARFKAGAVLRSDLLRAGVQLAEVKEMVTRSENGVKLAMANLNFVMGVPQQTEYDIQGSLAVKTAVEDLETATARALAGRPDLLSVGLNRKNAEAGVRQARTDYLPALNLMGQVDWNSGRIAGDDAKSWAVMAVLSWNIFDGLATTSNVRQASAAAARVRALEEQMRAAAQLQVKQAYYNFVSSLERIEATASSVKEAEEGLRIVQKRYEVGMTTLVDVLGAENALIRARTSALQALYDNNVAEAELGLAMGTL